MFVGLDSEWQEEKLLLREHHVGQFPQFREGKSAGVMQLLTINTRR